MSGLIINYYRSTCVDPNNATRDSEVSVPRSTKKGKSNNKHLLKIPTLVAAVLFHAHIGKICTTLKEMARIHIPHS